MELCSKVLGGRKYFIRVYQNGEAVVQSRYFDSPEEAQAWATAYSKGRI